MHGMHDKVVQCMAIVCQKSTNFCGKKVVIRGGQGGTTEGPVMDAAGSCVVSSHYHPLIEKYIFQDW